jgi:hypothetical protein
VSLFGEIHWIHKVIWAVLLAVFTIVDCGCLLTAIDNQPLTAGNPKECSHDVGIITYNPDGKTYCERCKAESATTLDEMVVRLRAFGISEETSKE